MGSFTFEIGGETELTLLPEADGVRCRFLEPEPNKYNDKALRFPFQIVDETYDLGDSDEVDEAIQNAAADGFVHYENVNLPQGKIGKRTKFYKLLKGMSGGDFDEGASVDLDDFIGKTYLVDFEHVDKMMPDGNGGFSVVRDDSGRTIKKAAIAKLRPERRAKKATNRIKIEAPVEPNIPGDDSDLDDLED